MSLSFNDFSKKIKSSEILILSRVLKICTKNFFQINDMDMKEVTREEAVLFLLSLQEQIDLIVQHRRQEYDQIVASGRGDSFHIK